MLDARFEGILFSVKPWSNYRIKVGFNAPSLLDSTLGAVTHTIVNHPAVPHTWVLVYRVNQRSHVTKITEVKRNLTHFIGGKFNHNFISIVIGSCTSAIKTPFQLTTLNVMVASSDLFQVSMEIYHEKFTLGNVGHAH